MVRPPSLVLRASLLYAAAALVGVAGAFCARGFQRLVDLLQVATLGTEGGILAAARALPIGLRLCIPAAGAVVGALIVRVLVRRKTAFGIADLMEVVSLRKLRLSAPMTLARSLSSSFVLASGGSVGREGPIVQLSATVASYAARWVRAEPRIQAVLLGCGVSAGMASAYNAPLAGAFFAMEVVLANFALEIFAPVVLSAAVATLVMWGLSGDVAIYMPSGAEHLGALPILAGLPLGAAGGVAGVLFVRVLEGGERVFRGLRWPPEAKAAAGGLVVGAIGIGHPEVWGNGYDAVSEMLAGQLPLTTILLLLFLKPLATAATVGSGSSGGVFTPTLFVGAALGLLFGAGFARIFPLADAPLAAFGIMGMAALIAGTTQAPVTSAVLLFEMTHDQALLLPLLLTTMGSVTVSRLLSRDSIYARKLRAQGVPVDAGLEELTLRKTLVRDLMRGDLQRVTVATLLDDVLALFQETRRDVIYVVEGKELVGRIRLQDVKNLLNLSELGPVAIAADVMDGGDGVDPDASIAEVIELFDALDLEELPVTKMHDGRPILVGRVTRRDLIACLNLEVLKRQSLRAKFVVQGEREPTYVELPQGSSLARVPLPDGMAGRTVAESGIPDSQLTLLTVIERDSTGTERRLAPHPELVLRRAHALVVLGTKEAIEAFRAGREP